MAIGEFGRAATLSDGSGTLLATPMYWFYEMGHAALNPARAFADCHAVVLQESANPLAHTSYGKSMAATMELFERSTRRYRRPEWDIDSTTVGGEKVPVQIKSIWSVLSVGSCTLNVL
jgi:poly(3-hydroxybutyrate) depolymerase